MYIWIAINIEEQLKPLRECCEKAAKMTNISRTALKLPLHISMKISFFVDDDKYPDVVKDILDFYKTLDISYVSPLGIEKYGNIIWLRHNENRYLCDIHRHLNDFLLKKYGIPIHEYDKNYIYHTTLFIDDDTQKLNTAYNIIINEEIPQTVKLSKFLVGLSPDGKADTFKVYHETDI